MGIYELIRRGLCRYMRGAGCETGILSLPWQPRPFSNRHADRSLQLALCAAKIVTYNSYMTISVTEFKAKCLEVIRAVEAGGEPVDIVRRGRVVARLMPAAPVGRAGAKAWQRLHGTGTLNIKPGESVLRESDFEALK